MTKWKPLCTTCAPLEFESDSNQSVLAISLKIVCILLAPFSTRMQSHFPRAKNEQRFYIWCINIGFVWTCPVPHTVPQQFDICNHISRTTHNYWQNTNMVECSGYRKKCRWNWLAHFAYQCEYFVLWVNTVKQIVYEKNDDDVASDSLFGISFPCSSFFPLFLNIYLCTLEIIRSV